MLTPSDKETIDIYRKYVAIISMERAKLVIYCEWGEEGVQYFEGVEDEELRGVVSQGGR